jgi:hypothetical protein
MLMLQGVTARVFPSARGEGAGNVDEATLKMHESKVVAPIAVLPPDVTVKAGMGDVSLNVTVVADVLPNNETPEGNENAVLTTAPVMAGDTATVVSATAIAGGASPPAPPPQALKTTAAATASKTCNSLPLIFLHPLLS